MAKYHRKIYIERGGSLRNGFVYNTLVAWDYNITSVEAGALKQKRCYSKLMVKRLYGMQQSLKQSSDGLNTTTNIFYIFDGIIFCC